MALAVCGALELDESSQEKCAHGNHGFPVAVYEDDLNKATVPLHWHVEAELIAVSDGEGIFSCNGKNIRLTAGQGIFFNSGSLHGCRPAESGKCVIHSIVAHPRFIAGEMDNAMWNRYILPVINNHSFDVCRLDDTEPWKSRAISLIQQAWNDIRLEADGYEFSARSCLSELWLLLWQNMEKDGSADSGTALKNLARTKRMLEFIENSYAQEIRTEDIAASAAISVSECQRCFKNVVGKTPNTYLNELRLQKACDYLANTELPVARVAELCGYYDNSYFGKLFRREKGTSPAKFRAQYRSAEAMK